MSVIIFWNTSLFREGLHKTQTYVNLMIFISETTRQCKGKGKSKVVLVLSYAQRQEEILRE